MRKLVLALALGGVIAACSRGGPSAPVVYGDPPPEPSAKPAEQAAAERRVAGGNATVHVVRKGDTVYGIARRYSVPLRAVIDANDLEPPYLLRVGQPIVVPQPRQHVVERGDTVYSISRRYGIDMSELTRLNGIAPPYTIVPDQVLRLPGPRRTRVAMASPDGSRRDSAERGDGGGDRQAGSGRPVRAASAATEPRRAAVPQPPPRAGSSFLWPLRGRVIAGYGPQQGGLHNDGINIGARRGTPVRAAENGVVAYAGNELRGFGKLLLIKHAGGWVTAYAHNDELLVSRGQRVRRGQPIARLGSSGSVSSPQLHFEIRRGTRAIDPVRLLSPQQARLQQCRPRPCG